MKVHSALTLTLRALQALHPLLALDDEVMIPMRDRDGSVRVIDTAIDVPNPAHHSLHAQRVDMRSRSLRS